jgi:hypothetical protein
MNIINKTPNEKNKIFNYYILINYKDFATFTLYFSSDFVSLSHRITSFNFFLKYMRVAHGLLELVE